MNEGFLDQVLGAVISLVLAASVVAGGPSQDGGGRLALADRAEASAGKPVPGEADAGQGAVGRDISWPNCPRGMGIPQRRTLGKPMPPPGTDYVVIGLTNGPGFYPNPCLAYQVAYARELNLWAAAYAVVTYPTPSELTQYGGAGPHASNTKEGRLRNAGWAQARKNIANMRAAGLESPIIWVDVEPVLPPSPWSDDIAANRFVVEGAIGGYRAAGLEVGVYSTTYLWQSIVGATSYGLPEWRAAGQATKAEALARCTTGTIQGGDAVLGQWATPDVDFDVLCPGPPAIEVLRAYFSLL